LYQSKIIGLYEHFMRHGLVYCSHHAGRMSGHSDCTKNHILMTA